MLFGHDLKVYDKSMQDCATIGFCNKNVDIKFSGQGRKVGKPNNFKKQKNNNNIGSK